jgi:hypothetical protein
MEQPTETQTQPTETQPTKPPTEPMKNPFTQTQSMIKKKKKLGRNELSGLGIVKEEGNFIITFL